MEDQEIVSLFLSRNERAIRETDKKYHNYLFSIARNILLSDADAEETVNDALFGVWRSIPPHRPNVLSAFAGKVVRYAALKKRRFDRAEKRGGGEMTFALDELTECVSNPDMDSGISQQEITRVLNAFLARLKTEERNMFILRYWYFESITEVAARFSCSSSKVKTTLWRTRARLKDELTKEGIFIETR